MGDVLLAVNGTLMRGMKLNGNMLKVEATFVSEAKTNAEYRLWTINDVHPAMQRVLSAGVEISLEIWAVPVEGVSSILLQEPPGLSIGKVTLSGGEIVLGVLGEAALSEGQLEISRHGGWREYLAVIGK